MQSLDEARQALAFALEKYPERVELAPLRGIQELIEEGREVRVVDNETGEDITSVALSQILVDSERQGREVPKGLLSDLFQRGGDALYGALRKRVDDASEGIDVSLVNPGFVDTPLTRKNDFPMPFLMDVDAAAKRIVSNLGSRPRSYSFPLRLSALLSLSKIMPRTWQKMVATKDDYTTTESNRGAGK